MIRTTIPCPPGCFWVEDDTLHIGMLVKAEHPASAMDYFRRHTRDRGLDRGFGSVYDDTPIYDP